MKKLAQLLINRILTQIKVSLDLKKKIQLNDKRRSVGKMFEKLFIKYN